MFPFLKIGPLKIPMYGLCIVAGIFCAGLLALGLQKRRGRSPEDLLIVAGCGILFGMIGSKTLYLLVTYSPEELGALFSQGVLAALGNSGFVFYGGLLLGIPGALLGSRLAKCPVREVEGVLSLCVPLCHGFGRLGCFCAGCCYGAPVEGWPGVAYTCPVGGAPAGIPLFPVQLLEAGICWAIFGGLLVLFRKGREAWVLPVYLLTYSTARFGLEYLRFDGIRGIWAGLSTSQLISIALFLTGGVLLCLRKKHQKIPAASCATDRGGIQ